MPFKMTYDIKRLSQLIRQVDQNNELTPVALAGELMPFLAEYVGEELDRRVQHVHEALMWGSTALAAAGREDKVVVMEGRSRTVKEILDEATAVLSSNDVSPLGALCARIHVTSTDTYPELSVEVMDGSHLQPCDSPIDVYALPPARRLVFQESKDHPFLDQPDAWLLSRADGSCWAVTDEPTPATRVVYAADGVSIEELVLRRNTVLPPREERKLFESWARTVFDAGKLVRAPWPHDEEYAWSSAQHAWQMWKFLRKLSTLGGVSAKHPGPNRSREVDETFMPLDVDRLAQHIRFVDGEHKLGAGALAESLLPFIEGELRKDSGDSGSAAVTALLAAARAVVQSDDAQTLTSQLINSLRSATSAVEVALAAKSGDR